VLGRDLKSADFLRRGRDCLRAAGKATWRAGDRNAITLTKEATLRVVLIAMKKGAKLREHQASGPITIQAASGSLPRTLLINAEIVL